MFAEAIVPRAETAQKQSLLFAPWASAASEERVCVRVESSSHATEEFLDTARSWHGA